MGIETINKNNLKAVKKIHNKIEQYKNIFMLFNKNEIPVFPGFVFGFDYDDIGVFPGVIEFLNNSNVQRALFSILTPFPGTELYRQLKNEGRITNNNLSLYDVCHAVFQPKKMSKNQLEEGFWNIYKKYYSIKEIGKRLFKEKNNEFLYSIITNLKFRKLTNKRIYPYNSGLKRINT